MFGSLPDYTGGFSICFDSSISYCKCTAPSRREEEIGCSSQEFEGLEVEAG